jgi:hypothetical protein
MTTHARTGVSDRIELRPLEFLPSYYEQLDAGGDILPRLAPTFSFAFLWSDERGSAEFAGGYDEFDGYMAQREPEGQRHHLDVGASDGTREVALGYTTRNGKRLGTFMSAAWLDADGRAERLFSARTLAFGDIDLTPDAGKPNAGVPTTSGTLMRPFLKKMDEAPLEAVPTLGADLRFAILWSDDRGVHEFAGGMEEYQGYLEQREPEGQLHHLVQVPAAGGLEVSLGYTTKYGDELGTFLMFTQFDADERIQRLMAARTLAFNPIWGSDVQARAAAEG